MKDLKSVVVQDGASLLNCLAYIDLNPIRAGIIKNLMITDGVLLAIMLRPIIKMVFFLTILVLPGLDKWMKRKDFEGIENIYTKQVQSQGHTGKAVEKTGLLLMKNSLKNK